MIRFDNVGLRYGPGDEVLSDVSFHLEPGSFHFLTGKSGAGKSSLLKLVYLSCQPSRGLIHMMDQDLNTASRDTLVSMRQGIGVVFQDYRLLEHLSTFENVALPLRIKGASEDQVQEEVSELLAWVGLADHLHELPSTLSGGQKQRASIARAVVTAPKILLADEPTGNVDDEMALRLMQLFVEMNKVGTTLLIATHDTRWVDRYTAPQLHLDNGRLSVMPAHQPMAVDP
ncbi:MAG: cell division ATP-binding protein FtsE [Alphaproteobacteria bacterium]|nr:MAG: cell division ATP-binding protein FtsE [Alphaproteobacteria bacterium]